MLELVLQNGYFTARCDEPKYKNNVRLTDVEMPSNYLWLGEAGSKHLPPIREAYDALVSLGYDSDKIISRLVSYYLTTAIFRLGHLKKLALVLGFFGNRGSGKTCSAVATIIYDFMLRGFKCFSNVPIAFNVRYRDCVKAYASEPLNKMDLLNTSGTGYTRAVCLLDELNMEFGDSSRFMSNANLQLGWMLQQLRKRFVSVVFTLQQWNSADPRLRFQTDFAVHCTDPYLVNRGGSSKRMGSTSQWSVFDLSGLSGAFGLEHTLQSKYITDFKIGEWMISTQPFWGAYETEALQGGGKGYIKSYNEEQKNLNNSDLTFMLPGGDMRSNVQKFCDDLETSGLLEIEASKLWERCGIKDRGSQTKVGQELHRRGWESHRGTGGMTCYKKKLSEDLTTENFV